VGFEGGQMPLQRRIPKLAGFTNRNRVEYATVNVGRIDGAFDDGDEVTPDALRAQGLIRRGNAPVKILGNGELSKKLTVSAHAFTGSARSKVESGGGTVRELSRRASGEASKP
jgi:large subunit ribosomal protein L15